MATFGNCSKRSLMSIRCGAADWKARRPRAPGRLRTPGRTSPRSRRPATAAGDHAVIRGYLRNR
eukprot:60613-Pyramimonas_sp.AAC.1